MGKGSRFEILVDHPLSYSQVIAEYEPGQTPHLSSEELGLIDSIWNEAIGRAAACGAPLFNGKLFRLVDFQLRDSGTLHLRLGDTCYKEYVGMREPIFYRSRPRADLANPIAVCAVIITDDNRIVLHRRKWVDVYPLFFHVIGGFIDRDRDAQSLPLLAPSAIAREVAEELGLTVRPEAFTCLGLVYDLPTPHPELCFYTRVPVQSEDLRKVLPPEREAESTHFIPNDPRALHSFILENRDCLSATGEPALLLYGKRIHGEQWFSDLTPIE